MSPSDSPDPIAQGLLRSLRERVLDEGEPLGGLLRICLMLGAVTGSDALRVWAGNESKGYAEADSVPGYRRMRLPLFADSISGNLHATGQQISQYQVPKELRGGVPEELSFRQSVEELEALASETRSLHIGHPDLAHVAAAWSSQLGMYQDVTRLYYQVSPSAIAGMIGRIRTTLVEMVAELASEVPFDELPTQKQVDAAVQVYVNGPQDNSMNFGGSNYGVAGQGAGSRQTQQIGSQTIGVSETGLVELIDRLRSALPDIENLDDRADVEQALDDLEEAATEEKPEPEKVRRRFRALERVTVALGSVFIREGVAEIADAVTGMLGS